MKNIFRDVLAIWTKDAELTVINTPATAGNYIGNGDPDDPATCPTPLFARKPPSVSEMIDLLQKVGTGFLGAKSRTKLTHRLRGQYGEMAPKYRDSCWGIKSAKKRLASGVPPICDVASNLGVSGPTLYRWIPASTHP